MENIRELLKKSLLGSIDCVLICTAYLLSEVFVASSQNLKNYASIKNIQLLISFVIIYIIVFQISKVYNCIWTRATLDDFLSFVIACLLANSIISIIITLLNANQITTQITIKLNVLAGIFVMFFVLGLRVSFRVAKRINAIKESQGEDVKRTIIIGAGEAGSSILKEIKNELINQYKIIGLIDDDRTKKYMNICGTKVLGNMQELKEICKKQSIEEIIIAIPSLSLQERKEIARLCKETGCIVKTIPSIGELLEDKVSIKQMREVEIEDLLGREVIKLNNEEIEKYISEKVVLVTGGGGSIGSELCRQILRFKPKKLLLLDIYENNAYDLQNELKRKFPELKLETIIASVRDKKRINDIFIKYRPEIVFHAAAHKHVPLMEDSPGEAIKNNVFGTLNMAECADKHGVKRFVLISTDKAVNPTNVMGATKRMCEMVVQAINKTSKTEFVAVRFGNVLGSNGSVIPLFKNQIKAGGPVTVTNKYITRFFMTIPEAAQLVLQAGAYAKGGEIFVLDMGKAVKIYDLAKNLISLSGLEIGKDIDIEITGLRPGEKLYEELLMSEEGLLETPHEKIFIGKPGEYDLDILKRKISNLKNVVDGDNIGSLICEIEEIVPTYVRPKEAEVAVAIEK